MSIIAGYYRSPQNLRGVPAPTADSAAIVAGGIFEWDPTSAATADDLDVIAVTGVTTGRWIRARNTGSGVADLANDATVEGQVCVIPVAIADGATADKDVTVKHKIEVIDVVVEKQGAAGGANDKITVKNAATAITDVMDINVADKAMVRALTIDDAQSVISAGGTLRVTKTKASANNVACLVNVICIRRA